MYVNRFKKAEEILIQGKYFLERKTTDKFYFVVDDSEDNNHYSVIIGEHLVSCSCKYGSIWGVKRYLPCCHILAGFGALMRIEGPMLRKNWRKEEMRKI